MEKDVFRAALGKKSIYEFKSLLTSLTCEKQRIQCLNHIKLLFFLYCSYESKMVSFMALCKTLLKFILIIIIH